MKCPRTRENIYAKSVWFDALGVWVIPFAVDMRAHRNMHSAHEDKIELE